MFNASYGLYEIRIIINVIIIKKHPYFQTDSSVAFPFLRTNGNSIRRIIQKALLSLTLKKNWKSTFFPPSFRDFIF